MDHPAHPGWCENLITASHLEAGERVLVVVDEPLAEEGARLAAAVADAGGEPRLELWAGERPLAAPPHGVAEGAASADSVVLPLAGTPTATRQVPASACWRRSRSTVGARSSWVSSTVNS